MNDKRLPVGIEDFAELIQDGGYYVDKTLFIKELLDLRGKANLFTRPRRFGKTLNLSMLRRFFEKTGAPEEQKKLFTGLAIERAGEKYLAHMGKYPVISLSLKSAKQPDWELAYDQLVKVIIKEFRRHIDILDSDKLMEFDKVDYMKIASKAADRADYSTALQFLSECLYKAYGEKVIILIDEYDVPLENAYFTGFYDEMIGFIRSLFESALKTNESLAFAVMTGCLRISKESIFTGLNNLKINSITQTSYAEHFGFTEVEVAKMLADYGLSSHLGVVQKWYDGYQFGRTEVYNPWSMINYVSDTLNGENTPAPYWSNTSGNTIVKSLLERADMRTREELETLIAGGSIEKQIHEDITYGDIYDSMDNLWNFLYFTGYLTKARTMSVETTSEETTPGVTLRIPNKEVSYIYENQIRKWTGEQIGAKDHRELYEAVLSGEAAQIEDALNDILFESISYMDSLEAFYHGWLAGVLSGIAEKGYRVISNRESGHGRSDLYLLPPRSGMAGAVIELKAARRLDEMDQLCKDALKQIEEKDYAEELRQYGCKEIYYYGIAFFRKECRVQCMKEQ